MKKFFNFKIVFSWVAIGFVSFGISPASWAVDFCGSIEDFRGPVEVLRFSPQGTEETRFAMKAQNKMNLECSDIVVTQKAGRALLKFKNQATLSMGPFSRVEILDYLEKQNSGSSLRLTYGKLRALWRKIGSQEKNQSSKNSDFKTLRIQTPAAVAGVRGTDFFVSYEPNTKLMEQATVSGSVEVQQVGSPKKVTVEKGFQVSVENIVEREKKETTQNRSHGEGERSMKVLPISPQIVQEIRQTSVIAKASPEFASPAAKEILGAPDLWILPADELPVDLKDIKEEF